MTSRGRWPLCYRQHHHAYRWSFMNRRQNRKLAVSLFASRPVRYTSIDLSALERQTNQLKSVNLLLEETYKLFSPGKQLDGLENHP